MTEPLNILHYNVLLYRSNCTYFIFEKTIFTLHGN